MCSPFHHAAQMTRYNRKSLRVGHVDSSGKVLPAAENCMDTGKLFGGCLKPWLREAMKLEKLARRSWHWCLPAGRLMGSHRIRSAYAGRGYPDRCAMGSTSGVELASLASEHGAPKATELSYSVLA